MTGPDPESAKQGRPALPPDLTREIKQFLAENPDMGENNLSGFVTSASKLYLQRLRYMKFIKLVTNSAREGKIPAHLMEGLRLPGDVEDLKLPDDATS